MASTADQIPEELRRPERKAAVIEWINDLHIPSRFSRKLLQDWGVAVGVELQGTDYELVSVPHGVYGGTTNPPGKGKKYFPP